MPDSEIGSYEEPDADGNQSFIGNPEKPNFGKNTGKFTYDSANDRLIIIGSIPIFTHSQIFLLDIENIELLVSN